MHNFLPLCTIFSLCYLKFQKVDDKKAHSQQEHCLSYQGTCRAVLGGELLHVELHLPQDDKNTPEVLGRFVYPEVHTAVWCPAKQIHWILYYATIMLHKNNCKCDVQRSALLLAPRSESEFSAILNNPSLLENTVRSKTRIWAHQPWDAAVGIMNQSMKRSVLLPITYLLMICSTVILWD